MNTQEVIAKLNKYKQMLEQETDADIKSRYASKISQLEASLKEAEQKVEKLEEKVAIEEKKELSEAEKKIKKYQDYLDGETDPDLKTRYQKKIKELQDSLKEVKEEIKEEKKEVAEQKVEIKKAIKAVKSVKSTKVEKKEAIEKVEKKVRERKEVSVKRTRRSKKIKKIMTDLDKLIEGNKKLKTKYIGKGVDLKKDASRSAKPFGYRFAGKHDYRVPTKAQIKAGKANGKVVYEGRANRSDVYPNRAAKLAKGGQINMDKHIWEGWTVGSFIEELDLDFRYHPKFKSRDEVKKWAMENQPYYKKYIPEVVDYYWEKSQSRQFADGGMMGNKYTLAEAKKMLDAEKSNNESFSWFVPDVDYEGEDYDQEYGVHLSDKGLLELADEIYKKGGKTSSEWDEKMKTAKDTLAFLKKEAENNPSPKMKKSVSDFEEYIKKLNQNKYSKGGKTPVIRTQFEEEEFEYAKGGVVGTYQLMPYVSMGGNLSQLSTPSYKDKVMFEGSKDEAIMKANNMVNNSDEIISVEVSLLVRNGLKVRDRYKKIEMVRGNKMAHGGHTQGYDDIEDERLAMKHGRMSKKDLDSTHARRDDARFEERGKMAKGGRVGQSKEDKARFAKPAGWRWKDSAVKKKIISTTQLSKSPTKAMREKYPNYVYFEDRLNKADKNPSRKYLSA